jgi:hypothetical protein
MAKCPKCSSRKGKRQCPALGTEICAPCCAEGRLVTIPCPQTCVYLKGEVYQHERRKERARARGRRFVEFTQELAPEPQAYEFAFKLQADAYFFLRRRQGADDASVTRALDEARNVYSKIFVPHAAPHPLGTFLMERLNDAGRYPPSAALPTEERLRVLSKLSRAVAALGGEGSHRYEELLGSFFDELDFESDLDYSPLDPKGAPSEAPGQRRSEGGLILP